EGDGAMRTRRELAASLTANARREPAPVQEEDRLLLGRERLFDRAVEEYRKTAIAGRAGADPAKVDDLDGRQLLGARALGEKDLPGFPRSRELLALEGRCRAPEDTDAAGEVSAQDRHVSCVIANAFFLFERWIVFFVDDDEAEVLHRSEEGAPRADGHVD